MASRKTVTTENLVSLGPERLAAILIELAAGQPAIKRRLRLELAGEEGGDVIAAEITRRMNTLRSARSFIDWQRRPEFARDLDLTRMMIVDRVGSMRPDLAVDLMWRFMALAEPILNRVDDSNGSVGAVFRTACQNLGKLVATAKPDPQALAERVVTAVTTNDYGEFDEIVPAVFTALGKSGVAALRARLLAALPKRSPKDRFDTKGWAIRRALQDIADGEGDVDAYIATVPTEDRTRPAIAAAIGKRLVGAGRAPEALAMLEAARPVPRARREPADDDLDLLRSEHPDAAWETAYIDALAATGQAEHAQRLRWKAFEDWLAIDRLRVYLKALPDFEDVLATERAMDHALRFRKFSTALAFFQEWPEVRYATRLVLERHAEVDGNLYYLLDPAARWLEGASPLAATVLRRAMIEDTLDRAKSKRYKHAVRHLAECASLAPLIADYAAFETHEAFAVRMRAAHARKAGFWTLLRESGAA